MANDSAGADRGSIERVEENGLPGAGEALTILTWNLGYAGLGAGSDFKVDGGQHYFPPSRRAVRNNADGIADFLRNQDADIVLLEELAHGGPINYWVDLNGASTTPCPGPTSSSSPRSTRGSCRGR